MILLKFKTEIKGNCEEKDHKGWIQIDSWAFSAARHILGGNDREPGTGQVSEMSMSKGTDIASANLFIESLTGKSLGEATIHIIQTSGSATQKNEPYLELTLTDPIISSYSISGGSDRPMESFHLSFSEIKFQYKHFINGKVTATVEKKYNLLSSTSA